LPPEVVDVLLVVPYVEVVEDEVEGLGECDDVLPVELGRSYYEYEYKKEKREKEKGKRMCRPDARAGQGEEEWKQMQ
jgi:hypothetical protein